jgi:hypothetical protein
MSSCSSAYASSNKTARFNVEAAMLLAALLTVLWLRLALPAINFGVIDFGAVGPVHRPGMTMTTTAATATATTIERHEMSDTGVFTHSQLPTDQRCRDTMPGCNTYLQGLCPFAPVFVVTNCTGFVSPWLVQAAPPPLAADDLSPLGRAPKIPPRP